MLAHKSKLKLSLMLFGTFVLMSGSLFGQQKPSQRYQPDRNFTPPSVHVAPKQLQKLPSNTRHADSHYSTAANPSQPAFAGAKYTFSDQNEQRPGQLPRQQGLVQQTSFQTDENGSPKGGPVVPAILAGKPRSPTQTAAQLEPPRDTGAFTKIAPRKTPDDFASSMKHARANGPRVSPKGIIGQSDDISSQMVELRRQAKIRASAESKNLKSKVDSEQKELEQLERVKMETGPVASEKLAAPKSQPETIDGDSLSAERKQAGQLASQRMDDESTKSNKTLAQPAREISASEFIGQISSESPVESKSMQTPLQDDPSAPKLVAKQVGEVPAVMQLANNTFTNQPVQDSQVRTVSSEVAAEPTKPSIRLSAPALEVETFGPATVGINKPSNYRVIVSNNSSTPADRILVGINMPQWIDIENVNMTSGGKEITDGIDQARLVWSIDEIPANSSQTITITAVPRKAEVFDVGVEWTLVPRVGRTNVTVTEPKLEMTIAGPPEVLYGETALYHVTVRNPGTGTADNVIVMLPEALGGERAGLGHIEAGKEKNFQVELLARTAGELNLVATAAAEGNLKTSAERALTVRRANLEIALNGPGLKYSGSMAQYKVDITNSGDATANEIVSAIALPAGVKYVSGVEAVKLIEGGMRWPVGTLEPGQTRTYKINCQLDTSGDLQLEVGARGRGDLAASSACLTTVETIADLVLIVADPKGPLPTGEAIPYKITVQNRGSKSAKGVNLVMQFSEGIEPKSANGLGYEIEPGQVQFTPISKIDPGQELTFEVTAEAMQAGTHIFRAQLICKESDAREIAEGTTRFFGDSIQPTAKTANSNDTPAKPKSNDFSTDFQR